MKKIIIPIILLIASFLVLICPGTIIAETFQTTHEMLEPKINGNSYLGEVSSEDITQVIYLNADYQAYGVGHAAIILVKSDGSGIYYSKSSLNANWYGLLATLTYDAQITVQELSPEEMENFMPGGSGLIQIDGRVSYYTGYIFIMVNEDQGSKILETANDIAATETKFNLYKSSCNIFVQKILAAGNISFQFNPDDWIPNNAYSTGVEQCSVYTGWTSGAYSLSIPERIESGFGNLLNQIQGTAEPNTPQPQPSTTTSQTVTETTAPIPSPSKPSLTSPYNWYQSLGESPMLRWQGDSNSASYYVLVNSSNTGNVVSGWTYSNSWKPNLPNQNYVYTWKVKARNSQGVEGPWSDESHFSIASTTLKFEGDISFSPQSPSSADQIKIFASTTGWGGVGVTLRVTVNTAPDGSANGEWKIIKELGVPKFNENDAPVWNTNGWQNGTYRVRAEAKGPNDPNWQNPAIIETTYTLVNKPIVAESYEEPTIVIDPDSLLLNEDFSSGSFNIWNLVGDISIYSDGGNLVAKCVSTDQLYTDMYYHFYIQSSTNQQIMINTLKVVNFSCRIKAVDFTSGHVSVGGAFISDKGELVGGFEGRSFSPGELPIGSWKTITFSENLSGYPDFDLIIIDAGSSSLGRTIVYFDDFKIY